VYLKLKEEIRSTFSTENEITLQKVNDLPYLNACIEERLRIFPPAPIGFLRAIQPGGDIIDGHQIPGGVSDSRLSLRKPKNYWLIPKIVDVDCCFGKLLVSPP
jgi:hypothetical protein